MMDVDGWRVIVIVAPDASVLLKWVLPRDVERDEDAALLLREEAVARAIELVVPQFWIYEVGNTLVRRFPAFADQPLASLVDFHLTEAHLDSGWRAQAASLTVTYGVSFYDAAYHVTALARGSVFVTANGRYVRRASEAGGVMLLRRWSRRQSCG